MPAPRRRMRHVVLFPALVALAFIRGGNGAVEVRIDVGQPVAVLAIAEAAAAGREVSEEAWERLFRSAGYIRLKGREAGMGRLFTDDDFRAFVLHPDLAASMPELRRALATWDALDIAPAATMALAYLPPGTPLRATIYPSIHPRRNSFVHDLTSDPAIFMALEPGETREKLLNTLAHELHHIGFEAACPDRPRSPEAVRWLGAFGEGWAMLAAAGGPDTHPHVVSPPAERERWDRDMARAGDDLRRLETFFLDVLDGRLAGPAIQDTAMTFFGVQGPWYTVGWMMAATVERAFGREALVAGICDPIRLLAQYQQAAQAEVAGGDAGAALWSDMLLRRMEAAAGG
jgi:hypothetical protein